MSKRKDAGASLAQYIIIIALIGMAAFVAFSLLGRQIVENLTSLENNYSDINKEIDTSNLEVAPGPLKGGDLGGTPTAPVVKCVESMCTIDYGEFVLNGLPDDFSEYIQSSGTSGGTDALASLLTQMSDQLESNGNNIQASDIKKLSLLVKMLGQTQKNTEDALTACKSSPNVDQCVNDSGTKPANIPLPDELQTLMPDYNSASDLNSMISRSSVSHAKWWQVSAPPEFGFAADKTRYPAFAMLGLVDKIMADPAYSATTKNVLTEIIKSTDDLGSYLEATSNSLAFGGAGISLLKKDPITGLSVTDNKVYTATNGISDITNPDKSNFKDLATSIMNSIK